MFYDAPAQLYRFCNGFGGFVSQVTNYSTGAASVIVPHIVGSMDPAFGAVTAWPTIAKHSKLMVLFGGIAPKNTEVNKGGIGRHETGDWLAHVRQAGVAFVDISPLRHDAADALGAEWLPLQPNTDVALMLGLAHTLITENLHDRAFLDTHTFGFERRRAYVMGESDGTPKDAAWAAAITQIPAPTMRALARRMAAVRISMTSPGSRPPSTISTCRASTPSGKLVMSSFRSQTIRRCCSPPTRLTRRLTP